MTTNNIKQRLTLFINPSIIKQARVEAIVEGLSLTALVERALIKYLPKETVIRMAEA
jgi:predicted HicB family RNase H-like nuclease